MSYTQEEIPASPKISDKRDKRCDKRATVVDNTCDGRRPVYHTERPPLSAARCVREDECRAGLSATIGIVGRTVN